MRKISTARSSRRAPPLKESDYDHEINLVDHAAETVTPQTVTPEPPTPERVEDSDNVSSPHTTADPGQRLSKYTTAVESPAPRTPVPEAEPSSGTKEPSPSRSTASRRSTGSIGSSKKSKKGKDAPRGSSLRRASRGRVAVPRVTVNGEHIFSNKSYFTREAFWLISGRANTAW